MEPKNEAGAAKPNISDEIKLLHKAHMALVQKMLAAQGSPVSVAATLHTIHSMMFAAEQELLQSYWRAMFGHDDEKPDAGGGDGK